MQRRYGFTLVEILVSIGVVTALIAVLVPAIHSSRAGARRTACQSNLRQLALAAHQYEAHWSTLPPGLRQHESRWSPRFRGTSLFSYLLPHLEQTNLIADWDYDAPLRNTEGGTNARSANVISVYLCPTDRLFENPVAIADRYYGMTSYGGNGGTRSYDPARATLDGLFHTTGPASEPRPEQQPVSSVSIGDGASSTILFGERRHDDPNLETFAAQHWAESLATVGRWAAIGGRKRIGDVTLSAWVPINYQVPFGFEQRERYKPNVNNQLDFETYEASRRCAFGSNHSGGANFAFADGRVKFLNDKLPLDMLRALCTRSGGEVVDHSQ